MTESPIIFKLCEIKVSLCTNKMTETYDSLFTNIKENGNNMKENICEILYTGTLFSSR